jgi:hypothetical protein
MNTTLGDLTVSVGWIQRAFVYIYTLAVFASLVYGIVYGLNEWAIWMDSHKPIKLNKRFAWSQPIINTSINAGYAVWHMITCGISTMFVAATFPISVPVITFFFSENDDDSENDDNSKQKTKEATTGTTTDTICTRRKLYYSIK